MKRVYVVPGARRQGLARKIVAALEEISLSIGFDVLWLETGIMQPEAISLYRKIGYQEMRCYGNYRDDGWSVCFQKRIRNP